MADIAEQNQTQPGFFASVKESISDIKTDFFAEARKTLEANLAKARGVVSVTQPPATDTPQSLGSNIFELMYTGIKGEAAELRTKVVERFRSSGTGQALIAETKKQEIAAFIKQPIVWIVGAMLAVVIGYGLLSVLKR